MVFGEEKMTTGKKFVCSEGATVSAWNKQLVVGFKGCIARALVMGGLNSVRLIMHGTVRCLDRG